MAKNKVKELLLLEEHFLDQLDYRIKSVFEVMNILRHNVREIESFIKMLEDLTAENLEVLTQELKK